MGGGSLAGHQESEAEGGEPMCVDGEVELECVKSEVAELLK